MEEHSDEEQVSVLNEKTRLDQVDKEVSLD